MKTRELFEAAEVPEWVKQNDADFKHLLRQLGFTMTNKPVPHKEHSVRTGNTKKPDAETWWIVGGTIRPTDGDDIMSFGDKVPLLPSEIAKFLLKKAESNRIVRIVSGFKKWRTDYRMIYPSDRLEQVTHLVKDHLRQVTVKDNRHVPENQELEFAWEMEPPRTFEKPAELAPARILRVIKKGTA